MTDADFRGTGWRFPVAPDDGGGLGYVSLDDNDGQSVELLLNSVAGERTMRLEFGPKAHRLLCEADSEQILFQLEQSVGAALQRWEPRVEVERVAAASD